MPMTARVFIGSSAEGLPAAQAVRSLLSSSAHVVMWNEGVFRSNQGFLETLVQSLDDFDFAVIIASPDDLTVQRGTLSTSPRDNIVFELGLFMGRLGRGRTFLLHPRSPDIRLPSDLLGVATAACDWPVGAGGASPTLQQFMVSVGAVCDEIRDALRRWRTQMDAEILESPGLVTCHTNATNAQAAISRAIRNARQRIMLTATNLSYTPVLNVDEFQRKIRSGVEIRFMVLNPMSQHVVPTAREFLISVEQLHEENRLHLRMLMDLSAFAMSAQDESAQFGLVLIRLYDAPPRMRSYSFDGLEGVSFFVPYVNKATSRPLPVYECRNDGLIARRYLGGIENVWTSPDTMTIEQFLERHPSYLGPGS